MRLHNNDSCRLTHLIAHYDVVCNRRDWVACDVLREAITELLRDDWP